MNLKCKQVESLKTDGYDSGILKDEKTPFWIFKRILKFKPLYSKILALQLGIEKIKSYLTSLEYGNNDISGGEEGYMSQPL